MRALASCLLLLPLLACGGGPEPVTLCEAERGIRPICGLQNPEDLIVLADGTLLVSQMGGMDGSRPGSLARFDPDSETTAPLFPRGGTVSASLHPDDPRDFG